MVLITKIRPKNSVPLRLTEERWLHIITSHTDMEGNLTKMIKAVEDPDVILAGISDELRSLKFFENTRLGPKHLVVAYKELGQDDGFVITAYKTSNINKLMRRNQLWTR